MSFVIPQSEVNAAITALFAALSQTELVYHVTGGYAAMFYGEPRFTYDLDLVIAAHPGEEINRLVELLSPDFFIQQHAVDDAVRRKSMFQAVHFATNFRADFHVNLNENGEFERSNVFEIIPGLEVPIISRLDAIVSKLIWIKKGSRQDVFFMLDNCSSEELTQVNMAAEERGLTDILESVKRKEF